MFYDNEIAFLEMYECLVSICQIETSSPAAKLAKSQIEKHKGIYDEFVYWKANNQSASNEKYRLI
jgi:hypothetical protein